MNEEIGKIIQNRDNDYLYRERACAEAYRQQKTDWFLSTE